MDWLIPVIAVTIASALAWLATMPRACWLAAMLASFLGNLPVALACVAVARVVGTARSRARDGGNRTLNEAQRRSQYATRPTAASSTITANQAFVRSSRIIDSRPVDRTGTRLRA
jgi:hypothetical protein